MQQLESACDQARQAGIVERDAQHFAYAVQLDFRELLARELEGDAVTLKARIEGLTKRMAADRPNELVAELWSE